MFKGIDIKPCILFLGAQNGTSKKCNRGGTSQRTGIVSKSYRYTMVKQSHGGRKDGPVSRVDSEGGWNGKRFSRGNLSPSPTSSKKIVLNERLPSVAKKSTNDYGNFVFKCK